MTPATDVTATDTETALIAAIQAERAKAGKPALAPSNRLAAYARGDSDAAASGGGLTGDTTTSVRRGTNFDRVGKLSGTFRDRGPQTAASFATYWATEHRDLLLSDWSQVGVGVSKSADGRLFAVAFFGGFGGATALMPY